MTWTQDDLPTWQRDTARPSKKARRKARIRVLEQQLASAEQQRARHQEVRRARLDALAAAGFLWIGQPGLVDDRVRAIRHGLLLLDHADPPITRLDACSGIRAIVDTYLTNPEYEALQEWTRAR